MLNNTFAPTTPAGLPSQENNISNLNGNTNALDTSNADWSGVLLPTSLYNDGAGTPINFPSLVFKEEQTNALAIHMYPNLDGARIENMGKNPGRYFVRAILTNDIFPGTGETWKPGTLFPTVFYALLNTLLDTTTDKIFVHPIYGHTAVQVEKWTYELNPKGPRDGAIIEMILLETISSTSTLSNLLSPPPGSQLSLSANALDTYIEAADGEDTTPLFTNNLTSPFGISFGISFGASLSINIPGLDLTGFFTSISVQVQSCVANPNNVVPALNISVQNTFTSGNVSGSLAATPQYLSNKTLTNIQAFKDKPLGYVGSNTSSPHYDQSTYNAMRSIAALNNTPSKNAFQFIDKAMSATVALQQHYINQNNSLASPIIESLRQFLLQLQQVQSSLSLNTSNQSLNVSTYLTQQNMTWMQLSSYLNNTIDDLMSLNQGLVNDFWVYSYTTINYFQS